MDQLEIDSEDTNDHLDWMWMLRYDLRFDLATNGYI